MTPEFVISLAKEAIILTILVALPMLSLGLIVGLLVSVFQAVTSIQEMTLSFIPKILAVLLGLLAFSPFMIEKMVTFTKKLIISIPTIIR